jgi:(1->4)-alpha-D-glucan 1-alpha-D-glucosylmutase
MNATSTHDSKRGEDVRARLNVLSEIPDRWQQAVARWAGMNQPHKQQLESGVSAPDRNDEYLLYQTLVGALPFDCDSGGPRFEEFRQRIKDYMVKAVREAKTHSNWVQPNEQYEGACRQFIDRLLDGAPGSRFWADFLSLQREVSEYGIYNSLSQTTLKMACPGVPDFYQGSELWDLSLVDPDNRRPVDFEKRTHLLQEIQRMSAEAPGQLVGAWMASKQDGRVKLFLIHRVLQVRRENENLFDQGGYLPASVAGSRSSHVVAFFRAGQGRYALVVVPRFITSLAGPGAPPVGPQVWEDTRIGLPAHAPADWRDAITGRTLHAAGEIPVADILATFPVSLLLGAGHARP